MRPHAALALALALAVCLARPGRAQIFLEAPPAERLRGAAGAARRLPGNDAAAAAESEGATSALADPVNASNASAAAAAPQNGTVGVLGGCLCLFDVDRTLTGKQERDDDCPGNTVRWGIWDSAYGGGTFTVSKLGSGMDSTPCRDCQLGIVSVGDGGSPEAREELARIVRHGRTYFGCDDKPRCAREAASEYGVALSSVYMFDDKLSNVQSFSGSGMNAQQVSCASRHGDTGYCGGEPWEVRLRQGVHVCH